MENKMEIITNQRGGKMLCYQGFTYTKKNQKKTSIRWECANRRRFYNCKGSATTDLGVTEVKKTTEHYHEAEGIEIAKVRHALKHRAMNSQESTSTILSETLNSCSEYVRANLPSDESLRRHIRKLKQDARKKEPIKDTECDGSKKRKL